MLAPRDPRQVDNHYKEHSANKNEPNTSFNKHFSGQYTEQRLEKQQNLPYDKITPQLINLKTIASNEDLTKHGQSDLSLMIEKMSDNFVQQPVSHSKGSLLKIEQAMKDLHNCQNIQNED